MPAAPRHHRRIKAVATTAATVLGAALLSSITHAPASGADRLGQGVALDRSDETGTVGFIGTEPGRPIDSGFGADASAAAVARSFLASRAGSLGLRGSDLRVVESHATPNGGSAVRLNQTYAGVPVLGGEFVVTLDAGNDVLSVLGEASPIRSASTTPAVSSAAAARTAVATVAREAKVKPSGLATSARPELMLYDPRLLSAPGPFQTARLAWVTEVRGAGEVTDIGRLVVVDAASGSVALSFETIQAAKDRIVCDANNTPAEYPCTPALAEWTEATQPAGVDADVELAFEYAGDTYDFFSSRFGRDSLDGAGLQLVSTTDYCPDLTPDNCPYENAFWDGAQMVYGDGFASADDVVGHELSHGVTDFSSSLFYYQQSGAINESMSDVFGELIDLGNGSGTDTAGVRWLLGEDIPVIGAIRNMANPPAFNDPDRMLSPLYQADPNETDGGGVHWNSGVNNKAAFLMVDGGTFNGQTITGIGITKAARIYYTVNNSMLVSGSDYADLANALRQSCTNLIGTDGITAADCTEVNKVVLATEMDQNPTTSPTRTATACPSGNPVSTVLADNLETPAGQYTTGATVGPNGWFYPQNPNPYLGYDATYATSGDTNFWGDDTNVPNDTFIRTTNPIAVPANAYLSFNHAFGFDDDTGGAYDGGVVEYSTGGAAGPWVDAGPLFTGTGGAHGYTGTLSAAFGNPLGGRSAFVRESNGYGSSRADLTSLGGQNVMFRWRIGTDTSFGDYGWFVDDIRIVTCAGPTPPPDTTAPQTTITKHPKKKTTSHKAKFVFSSSEPGSTFKCKLDKKKWKSCTSPKKYKKLGIGKHKFRVYAVDAAGNVDSTPAVWKWKVKP